MATGYVTVAYLMSLMILKVAAEDFSTRGITIQLPDGFNIDLENGKDFEFGIDAQVYKPASAKKITGSNLWLVSAWFGATADGSGSKEGFIDQTLNGGQSATTFIKKASRYLSINGISYSLAPAARLCRDLTYFCVQLGATPESSGSLNVVGNPDDSILTQCVEIQCIENSNICESDGNIYNVGDQWKPSSCESCTCSRGGTVECATEQCDFPCDIGDAIYTSGVCCPACPLPTSCEYEGASYNVGAKWTADVCTTCSCLETGDVDCVSETCVQQVCLGGQSSIFRPGVCCEICPLECSSDNAVYLHSEKWRPAVCSVCTCFDGSTGCETETCEPLDCDVRNQVKYEDQCCAECAVDCVVSFDTVIAHGDSWQPDVCTTCQCYNGSDECSNQVCEQPRCAQHLTVDRPDICCPVCGEECDDGGSSYNHLEQWSPNPCNDCTCNDGVSECIRMACTLLNCGSNRRQVTMEGQCCPVCSEGAPLYLRSNMVKIKFAKPKLQLKKKSAKLKIIPIITFVNDERGVAGTNLWKITAWLSGDEDGVSELARVEQILARDQTNIQYIANDRLNLGKTKVEFKVEKAKCNKFPFVCIRFDLTDNPRADGVSLFLDPVSVIQSCELIRECKDRQAR